MSVNFVSPARKIKVKVNELPRLVPCITSELCSAKSNSQNIGKIVSQNRQMGIQAFAKLASVDKKLLDRFHYKSFDAQEEYSMINRWNSTTRFENFSKNAKIIQNFLPLLKNQLLLL